VQFNRLCQLNVIEQVVNVSRTSIVRNAWSRQQRITIHGWIYSIGNGLLRDLDISITRPEDVTPQYEAALKTHSL